MTARVVAVDADALAFVYAVLDGGHGSRYSAGKAGEEARRGGNFPHLLVPAPMRFAAVHSLALTNRTNRCGGSPFRPLASGCRGGN